MPLVMAHTRLSRSNGALLCSRMSQAYFFQERHIHAYRRSKSQLKIKKKCQVKQGEVLVRWLIPMIKMHYSAIVELVIWITTRVRGDLAGSVLWKQRAEMRQGKTLTNEATVQQGSGGEPKQRSKCRSRQGLRLGSARAAALERMAHDKNVGFSAELQGGEENSRRHQEYFQSTICSTLE
ncbi:hypothetical protein BHE74_00039096 [Ensete ventricosum]|nr:hypothetical protein BHE74_00039096 [Ensete ventricosum]